MLQRLKSPKCIFNNLYMLSLFLGEVEEEEFWFLLGEGERSGLRRLETWRGVTHDAIL